MLQVKPNTPLSLSIITLSLAILIAFATIGTARADTSIEVASKATTVTVFPDGAKVQRAAVVDLSAGFSKVIISDLPVSLNESSLRLKGEADSSIKIGSIESKIGYSEDLARQQEQELQEAIFALRDERKRSEADISAAQQQINFISSLSKNKSSFWNEATSIEMLEQTLAVIEQGTTQAHIKILGAQRAQRKLDRRIQKLESDLRLISSGQKATRIVTVNLEAANATTAKLLLEYDLSNAGWQPLYDMRLTTENGTDSLAVEQMAEVTQNTGEDWSDIELTLSTARVARTTEAPTLESWFLEIYEPRPLAKTRSSYSSDSYGSAEPALASLPVAEGQVLMAKPMAPVTMEANLSGFDVTYTVPGRNSIPSDRQPHKFHVSKQDFPVELFNLIVPKRDEAAYLMAELTNSGDTPMLPGRMSLYRDGAFIGTGHLPGLQSSEETELSFGANDSIKTNYRLLDQEKSQGGIISITNSRVKAFQITVQNLFNQSQRIKIYDQLPVSTDEDITVEEMAGSTKPTARDVNDRKGVLVWDNSYKTGESRQIDFKYKVSFPDGKLVPGFE